MDVHGVVDPIRIRSVMWSFRSPNDGGLLPLVERGAGEPARGVHQVGVAADPRERLLDALEAADGRAELLADARVGAGGAAA